MRRKFYVCMDEANAGEGGGSSSGLADSGATGATENAGGQTGATGETDGAGTGDNAGTALSQAGQQPQTVAIPEKYQVKKEDGSIDVEASSLKLAEAYGHLEKRLGSGDVAPKAVADYQIAVPDELKDQWNPGEDAKLQDFLGKAHASGLTQKQLDLVMGAYFETAKDLVTGSRMLSADECVAELKTEWKTDEQYKSEIGKAFKAAQAYGDNDAEAIVRDYGNDPRIIRLLSRVGSEIGEDQSMGTGNALPTGQTVEGLMVSEAYTNPKHPDHARVSAQVQAYFGKQAEAAAKAGNVPLL